MLILPWWLEQNSYSCNWILHMSIVRRTSLQPDGIYRTEREPRCWQQLSSIRHDLQLNFDHHYTIKNKQLAGNWTCLNQLIVNVSMKYFRSWLWLLQFGDNLSLRNIQVTSSWIGPQWRSRCEMLTKDMSNWVPTKSSYQYMWLQNFCSQPTTMI